MKIRCLRHAQTGKAEIDFDRVLTPQGQAQAKRRREALGHVNWSAVVYSSALRAHQTAEILATPLHGVHHEETEALYLPEHDPWQVLLDAAKRIKGNSLRSYLDDSPAVFRSLHDHAEQAWETIQHMLILDDHDVLIVGHNVLLQAMAYFKNEKACACLVDAIIGECEGFVLEAEWTDEHKLIIHGCELIKFAPTPEAVSAMATAKA